MKLLIVLSLIAYGYAAKLDRTYLPPANAATAGGSPGSLTAPGQGLSFGQQAPGFRGSQAQPGRTGFGASQPSGPSGFGQTGPSQASGFGQISGQAGTGQSAGFGQTGQTGLGQGPNQPSSYGQPSGTGVQPPNFGQPGFGQGQVNQGFAGQSQQPERPQAAADRNAEILRYDNQIDGDNFAYNFDTSNGISAEESGVATNGVQAQGEYSYTGDDGQFYKITYTADENGYVPQGDHLPTAPPIPEEIQRSIEENARAAAAGTQEGAYNPDEDNAPQQPSYNQGQGQQQFRGSNGFVPSGSTGQAQTRPQGTGFQGSSQPGFNQPQTFNQGSSQPAFNAQSGNQQTFSGQNRPQGKIGGQAQGQDGYDYSRPQNQGRQPNGNANFIPSGPSTTPGAQNQGRPFQQGQNQLSQSGSFGPSKSNEVQYQPPAFNQPQRQPSGNQGFGSSGAQFNKGSQGATQRNQPSANQGVGSLFNQNQGLAPTGSQSIQGSPSFPQNRPTSNNQQSQQGFQSQRGSQGSQVQRGLGGAQNQDGYEYNRPQGTFNSGSQGQVRPQSQSPVGSGAQGGFPGAGPKGQSGFSSSTGLTRPGSGPQGQPQAGFPGSSVANRPGSAPGPQFSGAKDAALPQFGGQPQRPGSKQPNNPLVNQTFNQQRQETFGGPRQQPSFSQEEGYKY